LKVKYKEVTVQSLSVTFFEKQLFIDQLYPREAAAVLFINQMLLLFLSWSRLASHRWKLFTSHTSTSLGRKWRWAGWIWPWDAPDLLSGKMIIYTETARIKMQMRGELWEHKLSHQR